MQRMRPRPRCVASAFLLWGTSQDHYLGVSGSGMISPWQWTDVFLGTHPKKPEPHIREALRRVNLDEAAGVDLAAREAQGVKHGERDWEVVDVAPGRNPLLLWKQFELPRESAARLQRMLRNYFPLVKEYLDSDRAGRKKLLDAWIPAIADATLEAKLKNAIEEQWRLEIAPGQKNDPGRLSRRAVDRGAAKFYFLDFGEAKEGNAGGVSADFLNSSPGGDRFVSLRGVDWIRDLERTFGFGYQLLRSCAVDGYELPYFQQHVEKKWEALFNNAHSSSKASSLQRTLKAMGPPPEAGGPVDDQMGEESLRDYPPKKQEEERRDRQRLWRLRVRALYDIHVGRRAHQATPKAVKETAIALLGPVLPEVYETLESAQVEQEAETLGDALRSILDLRVDAVSLNELDGEQEHTMGRLSSYPEGLTLEQKATFRARRNLIEGERQREDLKSYAGEGMQLLQSALLPFAYGNADAWASPVGSMLDRNNELVEDLKKAAKSQSLSPKAKAVAKYAALLVSKGATSTTHQLPYLVPPTNVAAREAAAAMESNAGSACVRLFTWANRHQVLSRMTRLNLAVRLKVLANDGPNFGGELSLVDLIEREMPTAVGPVVGKSGSPLALGNNQKYTNLFYLLRDNTKKMLHEFPPVTWEDFDTWAKRHPEFVRRTPWDKKYVPPWERRRPRGVLPAPGGGKKQAEIHKAYADALGYAAERFQNYVNEHAVALQEQKVFFDRLKEKLRLEGPLMPTEHRKKLEEKLKVQQNALEAAKQQKWVELQRYVSEGITQQVGGAGIHEDFQSDAMAEAMRNLLETSLVLKEIEDDHALFAKFWTLLVGDKLLAAAGQEQDGDAKEKARKAAAERVMTKAAHKIKVFAPAGARQQFFLGPAPVLRERDAQPLEDWKADTVAQKFADAFHIPEDGHTEADPTAFDTLKAALKQAVERAKRVSKEAANVYKLWVAASKEQQGREGLNALDETARRGGKKAAVQMTSMNKNYMAAATPADANGTADAPPGGAAAQTGEDLDFPTALTRYLAAVRAQQDFAGASEEQALGAEEVQLFLDEALSYAGEHQNPAIAAAWNELGEGQKQEIVEELARESKAEYDHQKDRSFYDAWFCWAVTGIAVFAVGFAVVLVLLILECRRSVALHQRPKTKTKIKGVGQEQTPEPDRLHSAGQEPQRGVAPARAARRVLVPAEKDKEDEENDAPAPTRAARTRTADYRLYVRDQQPQPENNLVACASRIDPGGPGPHYYYGPAGFHFDPLRGNPQIMQPLVQEWQAVMGLQLHSKSEVDGGQARFLPPPENPHAHARTEQGNAAPPLPDHQYEVDGKVLGASGLVVPDRAPVPRAPPNSDATGASETAEGAANASPLAGGQQELRGPAPG